MKIIQTYGRTVSALLLLCIMFSLLFGTALSQGGTPHIVTGIITCYGSPHLGASVHITTNMGSWDTSSINGGFYGIGISISGPGDTITINATSQFCGSGISLSSPTGGTTIINVNMELPPFTTSTTTTPTTTPTTSTATTTASTTQVTTTTSTAATTSTTGTAVTTSTTEAVTTTTTAATTSTAGTTVTGTTGTGTATATTSPTGTTTSGTSTSTTGTQPTSHPTGTSVTTSHPDVGELELCGYVLNMLTSEPVAGAEVVSGSLTAVSGEDGYFCLGTVPAGDRIVTATHGWKTGSATFTVPSGSPEDNVINVFSGFSTDGFTGPDGEFTSDFTYNSPDGALELTFPAGTVLTMPGGENAEYIAVEPYFLTENLRTSWLNLVTSYFSSHLATFFTWPSMLCNINTFYNVPMIPNQMGPLLTYDSPGSTAYLLEPTTLNFSQPATLTLKYDFSHLPSEDLEGNMFIGMFDAEIGEWVGYSKGIINESDNTISTRITGFYIFAALYRSGDGNEEAAVLRPPDMPPPTGNPFQDLGEHEIPRSSLAFCLVMVLMTLLLVGVKVERDRRKGE